MQQHITDYSARLSSALALPAINQVPQLAQAFKTAWDNKKTIYLCGNGGSAGNAIHLANDFLYGAGINRGIGLRIESLSANAAVLTCLANDIGYEEVYAEQLRVKANAGHASRAQVRAARFGSLELMFAPGPEENHPRRSARPLERRNKEFVWHRNN